MKLLLNPFKSMLLTGACILLLVPNAYADTALLEITLDISPENRPAAVAVYQKYKQPFLGRIEGAIAKDLLVRGEDVQVLHKFQTIQKAEAYLSSQLFADDVVGELKPLLNSTPEIRIYKKL